MTAFNRMIRWPELQERPGVALYGEPQAVFVAPPPPPPPSPPPPPPPPPAPPAVASVTGQTKSEGDAIVYTVTLASATTAQTDYAFSLGGGTAQGNGVDWFLAAISNGVSIDAGMTTATVPAGVSAFTITIQAQADALTEAGPNETVPITVGGVSAVGYIVDVPPGACPPLPERYTKVTFDIPNPEVGYSGGLRADDVTVDGLYLLSSDGSNWYYCAKDPNEVLTLNVLDTSVSRYNRIRLSKAGPLTIKIFGSMGSIATVGADVGAWPDLEPFNDWFNLGGQCGEVITHVTFSRRTAELWAIDDVEFGTEP